MSKPSTKSSGIRLTTELYSWIDHRARKRKISRSQCVSDLVLYTRKSLALKSRVKQPWTVKAAKTGEYFSVGVILVGLQGMYGFL